MTPSAPTPEVELGPLDDEALTDLIAGALADTAIGDVMPSTLGPREWTPARIQEFIDFHHGRRGGLEGATHEAGFVVRLAGEAVGVLRLQRVSIDALEAGLWLARSARGHGVGGRVLAMAAERALGLGARLLVAETTATNFAALAVLERLGADISAPTGTGAVHAVIDLREPVRADGHRCPP